MRNWYLLKRALHVSVVCAVLGLLGPTVAAAQPVPDLAPYKTLATDALKLVAAGDMGGAHKKLLDLEAKWDSSGLDAALPDLDDQLDTTMAAVGHGDKKKSTAELNNYLQMIAVASKPAAHSSRIRKAPSLWDIGGVVKLIEEWKHPRKGSRYDRHDAGATR